ncbi:hypothetical protein T484DRAFT_1831026, partial [Baffinella frigidus]
ASPAASPALAPEASVPPPAAAPSHLHLQMDEERASAASPAGSDRSLSLSGSGEGFPVLAVERGTAPSKDDMRANVVKKYKTRIQELSQNLEASQTVEAQQRHHLEEVLRREAGKEESVRELRVTVERLTARLEEIPDPEP